jgi:exopolysaccharide production protein ExoQ
MRMGTLRDRAIVLRQWILIAALVGLLAAATAAPLMDELLTSAASGYRRNAYAVVALVAIIGVWPAPNWQRLLVIPWTLVLALAWCWLSLTWSVAPDVALVRLVLTTLVVVVAFATVRHLGYDRALATIRLTLGAVLLVNFAALLLYPDIAITHGNRYWSDVQWLGAVAHKNHAGALCAFTALIFLFDVDRRWRVPSAGVAAAAVVFLYFTVSRTAVFGGVAALAAGGAVLAFYRPIGIALLGRGAQRWRNAGYALAALFIAMILFFTVRYDVFLSLLTDSEGLSRRTVIWRQLTQAYIEYPLSGVGFGSYWIGPDDAGTSTGWHGWQGKLAQGHNGVLDILVQLGFLGFLLVFFAIVVWPVRLLARQIALAPQASSLVAALLMLCIVSNFTESGLLERDSLWNVLLMLTLALITALAQRHDPRAAMWTEMDERRGAAGRTVRRRSTSSTLPSPASYAKIRRKHRNGAFPEKSNCESQNL